MLKPQGSLRLALLVLVVGLWPEGLSFAQSQPTGIMYSREARPTASATATGAPSASSTSGPAAAQLNMTYHGGPVLSNSTTYAIWWGDPSQFPPDAINGVDQFLSGLNGSAYLAIADQYMFGQKATTTFGGNLFDPSSPPATNTPSGPEIGNHVVEFLKSQDIAFNPQNVYMVYASVFPSNDTTFCAFHSAYFSGRNGPLDFTFAYVPLTTNVFCTSEGVEDVWDPYLSPNNYSAGTREMVNLSAHEFMETITDPELNAWYSVIGSVGNEIGDLCLFVFQNWVPLTNSNWKVQEEWSNQASGCAQGAPERQLLGAYSNAGAATTFHVPGATYGIFGASINANGAIAGTDYDAVSEPDAVLTGGFVRDPMGNVTTVSPPGAVWTQARGINSNGAIAGAYGDAAGDEHGFLRDPLGNFTSFNVTTGHDGTGARSINAQGAVTGTYTDASRVIHGYTRDPLGNITTFDAPGTPFETRAYSINDDGVITGFYGNLNQPYHGFVRDHLGNITSFDVPGGVNGTEALSINLHGAITGMYTDSNFVKHGFVRSPSGTFTTFDAPGAVFGTVAASINNYGAVAGYFSDAKGLTHGYVRDPFGKFTILSDIPRSINDYGMTTGYKAVP